MAQITAKDVAALRAKTGLGMMDCKKALVEADGDMDKAVKILREKGLATAAKKEGRIAAEGVVDILKEGNVTAMIEVNSETDFVAKNDSFKEFVKGLLKTIIAEKPANVEELGGKTFAGASQTVSETLTEKIAQIGEKLSIRRFVIVDGITTTYIHGAGQTGVIVKFDADEAAISNPAFAETAKNVARQNIKAFAGDCDAIVTLCASCASHLKHGYRRMLGEEAEAFSAKVQDFSSFVHANLPPEALPLVPSKEKVAYHASCHLCRELGVREAPRALIRRAAEYVPSAEEESCCGFGGTFSAKFPEISAELMRKKLANVTASGAKRLVLDCPGCAMQLKGGADKLGLDLKVTHISELLAENMV